MKRNFTDQMNRRVSIEYPPKRIVSLVPSQTELLYDLGLTDEVVGQTLFCIHPDSMHQAKPRVGGTKKLNIEKIKSLHPDLVIGNKEENDQAQMEELMLHFPVWMSDIKTLDDALDMIERVGKLVDKEENANKFSAEIYNRFNTFRHFVTPVDTLYLIWREPFMAVGFDTFIDDMLKRCNLLNVCASDLSRYPEISETDFKRMDPRLILLSSEPYPFKQKHMDELQAICPAAKILLVDGEMFSWYGSRLLKSAAYLSDLINRIY